MKKELIETLRFIQNYDQDIVQDILIKIEDVQDELDNAAVALLKQHQLSYKEQGYNELVQYLKIMTNLKQLSEELLEIQNYYENSELSTMDEYPSQLQAQESIIKNYPTKYLSGTEVKQLRENRANSRNRHENRSYTIDEFPMDKIPYRYEFNIVDGVNYQGEIKGWNHLIIKLCEQLSKVEPLKLNRMPNEFNFTNSYDGHNYFSFVNLPNHPSTKVPNTCIYVETDLDDCDAKNLIVEILKHYHQPVVSLKLYSK